MNVYVISSIATGQIVGVTTASDDALKEATRMSDRTGKSHTWSLFPLREPPCIDDDCGKEQCVINHPYSKFGERIVYGNDIDKKYYMYKHKEEGQGAIPLEWKEWLQKWSMKCQ